MSEIDDKLNEKLRQQIDGLFDEDEEIRIFFPHKIIKA